MQYHVRPRLVNLAYILLWAASPPRGGGGRLRPGCEGSCRERLRYERSRMRSSFCEPETPLDGRHALGEVRLIKEER